MISAIDVDDSSVVTRVGSWLNESDRNDARQKEQRG